MGWKGIIDLQKANPITVDFMLYIFSSGPLPCNQHEISRIRNKPYYIIIALMLVNGIQK